MSLSLYGQSQGREERAEAHHRMQDPLRWLRHPRGADGEKYYATYFHVSTDQNLGKPPQVGTHVSAGAVVRQMGKSDTPSVHLHFEVRRATTVSSNGPNGYWPMSRAQFTNGWLDISPAYGGEGWGWGYLGQ